MHTTRTARVCSRRCHLICGRMCRLSKRYPPPRLLGYDRAYVDAVPPNGAFATEATTPPASCHLLPAEERLHLRRSIVRQASRGQVCLCSKVFVILSLCASLACSYFFSPCHSFSPFVDSDSRCVVVGSCVILSRVFFPFVRPCSGIAPATRVHGWGSHG